MDNQQTLMTRLQGTEGLSGRPLFELLESACEGSIIVDHQGRIAWISDKYRRLLNLPASPELLGKDIEQVIPHSLMRQVLENGKPQLLDLMRFDKRWFVVNRHPLHDQDGRIIGAIGFVFFQEVAGLRPLLDRVARLQKLPGAEKQPPHATRYGFSDLTGSSPDLLRLRQQALQAAKNDTSILLLGETGTGKELLAQAIHSASPRADAPFVGVNTAALPDTLVEAELFGSAAGAYTGAASKGRQGKLELAQGGTLFLDEIGDMPATVQAKLLRVLQERQFEPLGSNRVIRVDVRVIAATSRDLEQLVSDGEFRADLYYRLNVLPLTLPPLRDRLEDLPELCNRLTEQIALSMGRDPLQLNPNIAPLLGHYHWPGNIRELRNVLERAILFCAGNSLDAVDLYPFLPIDIPVPDSHEHAQTMPTPPSEIVPLRATLEATERNAIQEALQRCGGNRSEAARRLEISRATLYEKIQRLSIELH